MISFIKMVSLAIVGLYISPLSALAQEVWPSKPITLVVNYPAGGAADMLGRLLAPKMSAALGQPVVIENRGGGGGQVGAAFVARSKPDGYTLMLDGAGYAINPVLFPKLPYDAPKAFTPLGILAIFPIVLVVTPNYSAKSVTELMQMAQSAPGKISYASAGTGGGQHLAIEQLLQKAKVQMVHIPYKGGSPAMVDVMAGHVPVFAANIGSSLTNIKAGKLRPLAIMTASRSAQLPDVPTLAEAGIANSELFEWNGMFVPAGVPSAITAKLSDALRKALDSSDFKEQIAKVGGELFVGSNSEAANFIQLQFDRMGKIIRDGNIRPD